VNKYKFVKAAPLTQEDAKEANFFQKLIKNAASNGYKMTYNTAEDNYVIIADIEDHHYKELITTLELRGYDYVVEECFL